MLKTLPSNAGGVGSVPELRPHGAHGQKTKTQNRSNNTTNLIKTFKMVHIKKSYKLKKFFLLCLFGCAGSLLLHRFFSSCGNHGLLSSFGARRLIVAASFVAEHRL